MKETRTPRMKELALQKMAMSHTQNESTDAEKDMYLTATRTQYERDTNSSYEGAGLSQNGYESYAKLIN